MSAASARAALRHPVAWLTNATGGDSLPVLLLLGVSFFEVVDRSAAGLLLPEMMASFGLSDAAGTGIVSLAALFGLALTLPIAYLADRHSRLRIMLLGGLAFTIFSMATGLIGFVAANATLLLVVRSGAAVGQATVFPTHNSLLTDYYDIPYRPRVFSIHGAAQGLGLFLGPIVAGLLATRVGWQLPFLLLPVPCVGLLLLGLRLRDPARGYWERKAAGLDPDLVGPEDPPSMVEAWRVIWRIRSIRRIYFSLPFLAVAIIGLSILANLYYAREFGLDAQARGFIEAIAEPFQLVGLAIGAVAGTRMLRRGPSELIRMVGWVAAFTAVMFVGFALAPNVALTVVFRVLIAIPLAAVLPGVFSAMSMAIPARVRALGFSYAIVFVLPGLILLPLVGALMEALGPRGGMLAVAPSFLIAGLIVRSSHRTIDDDIAGVWTPTPDDPEVVAAASEWTTSTSTL